MLEDEDENGDDDDNDDDDDDDDDEDDDDNNKILVINKNAAHRGNIGGVDEDELADSFFNAHNRIPSSLSISLATTKKTKKSAGRGGSKAKAVFDRCTTASRVVHEISKVHNPVDVNEAGGGSSAGAGQKNNQQGGIYFF